MYTGEMKASSDIKDFEIPRNVEIMAQRADRLYALARELNGRLGAVMLAEEPKKEVKTEDSSALTEIGGSLLLITRSVERSCDLLQEIINRLEL